MRKHHYKTALITGASRGLGAAFARALPETDLVLVARSKDDLTRLCDELSGRDRRVDVHPCDLSDPAARGELIETVRAHDIDLLVNNAGIGDFGGFLDSEATRTGVTIDVNLKAPLELTRALLPDMLSRAEATGGRAGLINVSSSTAFVPVPNFAVYAASKAFILSWTEALTAELRGKPIDVLAFCPGAIDTGFGSAAGFSQRIPGAMSPAAAARAALAALGRTNTLALDQVGAAPLSAVALGRSAMARLLKSGIDRFA